MNRPWTQDERAAWLALDVTIATALDHERGEDDQLDVAEAELAEAFDQLEPGHTDPGIVDDLLSDSQDLLVGALLSLVAGAGR